MEEYNQMYGWGEQVKKADKEREEMKKRNPIAKSLRLPNLRQQKVRSLKQYTRKGKHRNPGGSDA